MTITLPPSRETDVEATLSHPQTQSHFPTVPTRSGFPSGPGFQQGTHVVFSHLPLQSPTIWKTSSVFPCLLCPGSYREWSLYCFPNNQTQIVLSWKENPRNDVGFSVWHIRGTQCPPIPSLMMFS